MNPLLTISIPTYNRSELLLKCLKSILDATLMLSITDRKLISIFISDNSSNNYSEQLLLLEEFESLNIDYSKNESNIGSDRNIAKCYTYPTSDFVMILGDDDFLSRNSLVQILPFLKDKRYPVIFLKAYGLTESEKQSREDNLKNVLSFNNFFDALLHRNIHLAFISSMIFKRDLYSESLVNSGLGTQLVQFNLVIYLLKISHGFSIFLNGNFILSTRNNSGGYNPVSIFYDNYFEVLELQGIRLSANEEYLLKKRLLHTFYNRSFSQYIVKTNMPLSSVTLEKFELFYIKLPSYILFYKRLFKSNSKLSKYLLVLCFLLGNMVYYPKIRWGDFYYHLKNKMIK